MLVALAIPGQHAITNLSLTTETFSYITVVLCRRIGKRVKHFVVCCWLNQECVARNSNDMYNVVLAFMIEMLILQFNPTVFARSHRFINTDATLIRRELVRSSSELLKKYLILQLLLLKKRSLLNIIG